MTSEIDFASTSIGELFAAEFKRTGEAEQNVFPDVEIWTTRLRLRTYVAADAEEHREIFANEAARAWSVVPQPYTEEMARDWCIREAQRIRRSGEGICWAGEDRRTGRLVGMTGFHRTDWDRRSCEVSASAAETVQGQGYATEALRAISHWLLRIQRFNRLQITADTRNLAPQLVADACGFVREGVMRNGGVFRGRVVDTVLYSLLPSDLDSLSKPEYQVRPAGAAAAQQGMD